MANTQKYLNHLLQSVGITPACSEEERAAAEEISRIFSNHGFEPEIQEFTSSSSPKLVRAVLCLLLFIGVLLAGFGGAIGLVGTLFVIICGVLFMLERLGRISFPRIGAGGLSQNVIAYHKAAGPLASPRNRPVVVVAHYDSPRADFLAQMPFATYRPILVKLLPFAMVIPVAVVIVRLLPLPAAASLILWVVALLISLVPLVSAVAHLANRYVLPYTSGAVCNKSSVAAMLGVMDAVSPFKGTKEFPDDVPFAAYMAEQRREFNDAFLEAAAINGQAPVIERGASEETFEDDEAAPVLETEERAFTPELVEPTGDDEVIPLTGATVQMPAVDLPGPIDAPVDVVPNEGAQAALDSLVAAPVPTQGDSEDEDASADGELDVPADEELDVPVDEPEEELPPVNDAGCIRYGLDTLRGLGMVAESCVIEYEPNALPKPKPKAVLNFRIRQTAPKPAAPAADEAPRPMANVPVPAPAPAPAPAPIEPPAVSEPQEFVAPVAPSVPEPRGVFEPEPSESEDEGYAYEPEAMTDDEYAAYPADQDDYEEETEEGYEAYEEPVVPDYTASSYGRVDTEAYDADQDESEGDLWEDDLDTPMEAAFEMVEDEDESDEYDADEVLVDVDEELESASDEDGIADDGFDDEEYGYGDAQEALYDEVVDGDEDIEHEDDASETTEDEVFENVDEYVDESDDIETESYEDLEVTEDGYEDIDDSEEPAQDDEDLTDADPSAAPAQDVYEEDDVCEPSSTAVMEHVPFEQQEDGSWAIGVSDDSSAETFAPGATAVMSALADPDAIETEHVETVSDEVEMVEVSPDDDVELGQPEDVETDREEEPADEPVEDIAFDDSMFDVEPLADDLDIMEAIFEPVDDEEDSDGVLDEDEVVFTSTEDGQPVLDHTVEFAAADIPEEASEPVDDEAYGDLDVDAVDAEEQPVVEQDVEWVEDELETADEEPELAPDANWAVEQHEVADAPAVEPEPAPVPVQREVRSIPNLPQVDSVAPAPAPAPAPAARPLTGSTQLFDMSSVVDQTMPAVPTSAQPVETVDSIMSEIEHDIPQRRQRSIKLPDISPTTGPAAQGRSRSSLFDLPDPSAANADPLASVSSPDVSSRAKGGTAQFSVVSSNDTPAPSAGAFETISAPAPAQRKKKRGLGGLFGRKKRSDEGSMSQWLGVDEDYDAKRSGRNIGSWDKFEGDDSWKGGAASDGSLTEDELRGVVASLGDDELLGHDIWFVATGASENGNAGIREFLEAHRDKLRGVFLINLECIGAGRLAMLTTEGERRVLKGDKRIMGLISRVSSDFHHEIGSVEMPYLDTDAHAAMEMSLRACTLAGVEGPSLACSHSQEDISLNVDTSNIALAADVITEVIRRS